MKKEKLLLMLQQSTLSVDPNSSDAYNKYYPQIEANLQRLPDNFELSGLSSLCDIEDKDNSLELFVRGATSDEVKGKLLSILTDVKTCANFYAKDNFQQQRRTATALETYANYINARQRKNHKIIIPIFIALFVIFSIAVVVFSVMDALGVFKPDTNMGMACTIISSAAGALDFIAGLSFFIYERHDDKQKQAIHDKVEQITSGKAVKVVNIGNKVKGDDINLGIINSRTLTDEEKDEALEQLISLCNVDNDVKGKNVNLGIINKK